jgi:hypothetical protein
MANSGTLRAQVVYPGYVLNPEDFLTFIELKWFTKDWDELGLRESDDDLCTLQLMIMCDPTSYPVISGTTGLRKLRFAPASWNVGKRGALRVAFVYFERFAVVLLVTVFQKNEKGDLSREDVKVINNLIARIETELAARFLQ